MHKLNLDFIDDKSFKEDSVREEIINPLLKNIGFEFNPNQSTPLSFCLSKKIDFTITGSNHKVKLTRIPDYVLYIKDKPICVLDAKSPKENIKTQNHPQQVLFYAINEKIKAPFYALCNGKEFTLFQTNGQKLILEIDLRNELDSKFNTLKAYLTQKQESDLLNLLPNKKDDQWYLDKPLPKAIIPQKQKAKRHFGCTAYFTRQSWDVVQNHIAHFTQEGDVVLDSFGGSGVSAIEAMMKGRVGIHIDLNPLSVFMPKALSAKVSLGELYEAGEKILENFENIRPKDEKEAQKLLANASYFPSPITGKNSNRGGGI